MTIRQTLFLGFSVLIGVFFLIFFIEQRLSSEVVSDFTDLNQSEEVIKNSNLLHKNMIDMQNSFRGYLLTGKDVFLVPYNEGIKMVPELLDEQNNLITNGLQRIRLDTIRILHQKWLEYADALIAAKRDTLSEANKKYVALFEKRLKVEAGKFINDEIRSQFTAFDRTEYRTRQARRTALRESISRTRNISILLTIFSVAIAGLSCVFIIRIIVERINKMAKHAESIAQGNFKQIKDRRKDEFRRLTDSLNVMSGKLQRNFNDLSDKNKELDQFAYVVSHDLKAPLHGIMSLINWIDEDHENELSSDLKQKVKLIDGRAKRLDSLINGLLDYARIGKTDKNLATVDVKLMLTELVEMLVPESFDVEIDTSISTIIAEKIRLEQVFANLISNAVKYNDKPRGTIQINCRKTAAWYEFSVSDNGPGILPEYHDKIFLMFQTLKERDAFESTGIGLAIVKKIIDDQKTTIRVESNTDGGAKFVFTWPIHHNLS